MVSKRMDDRIELLGVPMTESARIDVYSGVARKSGMIWGSLHRPAEPAGTVCLLMHPGSNFMGHYLLPQLAARGYAAAGVNTRYAGNDSGLIMENCVLDLGAAVAHLRGLGYSNVVLIGNSGGGGLVAMYQSQAESPTITATPAGDPPDLTQAELVSADAIVEFMAHPGRAAVYTNWLDPAIKNEAQPLARDAGLDMFDPRNGPPYSEGFMTAYREAQRERNRRITEWVQRQLAAAAGSGGSLPDDLPFVVHGTCADPRFLDLTIEPDDRTGGTLWGEAHVANYLPASLGHYSSWHSWLSQWGLTTTNCDGPLHLSRVSVPVLVMYGTADQACFRSDALSLYDAVSHNDRELIALNQADHYFAGRPDLLSEAVDQVVAWLRKHNL
jgi:alpha-beta hydrolase superfamily lysophospholipase